MRNGQRTIPVAKPWLGREEAEAAAEVVLSGWVTQGPVVAAFENRFAEAVGAPHACAVSNGTAALHLALLAAGVGPGDEVITVSHSFIATTSAIQQCGATPVWVDIQPGVYNMDPAQLESAVTPHTKAVLCVHQMGMPCDVAAVTAVAGRHGLTVIEDAACAAGSEIQWRGAWEPVGRPHGDMACFSFHPRKVLTTGEGGMLTTRNPEFDRVFRLLRHHGMSIPDSTRHTSPTVLFEDYRKRAFNYRMTDIQAAVGLNQLGRLSEHVARRRKLAGVYGRLLSAVPGVVAPTEPSWARSNWQSYCIALPERVDQRTVMQRMLDRGVATRRGIMCAHLEPANRDLPPVHSLAHSEWSTAHCIVLPLYADLTREDQERVVDALAEALR